MLSIGEQLTFFVARFSGAWMGAMLEACKVVKVVESQDRKCDPKMCLRND